MRRDATARSLGWVLPSVGVQALLTRLAETDLRAQLVYQHCVGASHSQLRRVYYGQLFNDRPFGKPDFEKAPRYGTQPSASPNRR